MIPSVAASERGTAQTVSMLKVAPVVLMGLRGVFARLCKVLERLQSYTLAEPFWIRKTIEGDSPVGERVITRLEYVPK